MQSKEAIILAITQLEAITRLTTALQPGNKLPLGQASNHAPRVQIDVPPRVQNDLPPRVRIDTPPRVRLTLKQIKSANSMSIQPLN